MDQSVFQIGGAVIVTIIALRVIPWLMSKVTNPTVLAVEQKFAAAEKRVEDYTHSEAVKLVGALLDHLADTSPAQAKIAEGQAEMAAQAKLLASIKARVAAAGISAAS